ncbi:MAG: hypothetical protein JWO31_3027, partial [Phycisphaerales bacterium]|nr:hypothetical protein [Phycisphaerales bacterium]
PAVPPTAAVAPVTLPASQPAAAPAAVTQVSGVFPHLAMVADAVPRTEAGTGALMPWAGRLWVVTYVAHLAASGSGTGLYEVTPDLQLRKRPESVVGTYANRFVHAKSQQLFIGPHAIDLAGNVRTIDAIKGHRLTATCAHLTDPDHKVYVVGMEGEMWEVDVTTLAARELFDLKREFELPKGAKPHFKGAWTHHGRVVVANNTFTEDDALGKTSAGRLGEWDGKAAAWTILERTSFTEVTAAGSFSEPLLCVGTDDKSVILKVHAAGGWATYRLPKHGHDWDQTSTTEWMRFREVETERGLLDAYGIFYQVPYNLVGGRLRGLRPISSHLRVVPDFCSWRGMLVLGGNQATPMGFGKQDRNPLAGQPQAGLWFGKTDDLWHFGKPRGSGGVWRDTAVKAGQPSDPFLMLGFDQKTLHLRQKGSAADPTAPGAGGVPVTVTVEVDFLGDGSWAKYAAVTVPADGYVPLVFPPGFGAEWVRVTAGKDCTATAHFTYE